MKQSPPKSPLLTVVQDVRVNGIIENIRKAVKSNMAFVVDPQDVEHIRTCFTNAILKGEQSLHKMAWYVFNQMAPNSKMESKLMVFGRCSNPTHEGLLRSDTLFDYNSNFLSHTDSYLAQTHLPICSICGELAQSIASLIQHRRCPDNDGSVLRLLRTRIKSTSHIAYKLADIVFDIDLIFKRDKIRNNMNNFITDVYGMKIVLNQDQHVHPLIETIEQWAPLEVVEVKDYTGNNRKESGFEALKLVTNYENQLIEVQIQSQRMFETERNSYTAKHQTYKEYQMEQRRHLGIDYTNLYQSLYKLLSTNETNRNEYIDFGLQNR